MEFHFLENIVLLFCETSDLLKGVLPILRQNRTWHSAHVRFRDKSKISETIWARKNLSEMVVLQYEIRKVNFLFWPHVATGWEIEYLLLQWGAGKKEIWDLAKLVNLGKSGWNFRIFEVLTPENVRNRLESIRHELQKWTNQIHIFSKNLKFFKSVQ